MGRYFEAALKEYFSRNRKQATELYKRFMMETPGDEIEKFYSSKKQGSILGDLDFIEKIRDKYILDDILPNVEVREKAQLRGEKVIKKIKKDVCRIFKVKEIDILKGKHGTDNVARQAALSLSKEFSGMKLSEIGLHLGYSSYRTVGSHCLNFQEKLSSDKSLEKKYNLLRTTYRQ